MKSEPSVFGFSDLMAAENQTEMWDGVRNYQARNFMRDRMRPGDRVLFYHSNCKPPAVAGIAEVASEPYPDPTQFDPDSKYFDPKSTRENPRWILVDVRAVAPLPRQVPLPELKERVELSDMPLVKKGNRLSIMPVSREHYETILSMSGMTETP
ncbi:MAG: EVE domain-containing protein [Spirochaetales bacterium]